MEIIIDGVIGFDFIAEDLREKLKEANGQNLDIQISSPGGSVYEGFTIFDLIIKYKKDFPNSNVQITSFGISASMASIIALAGDKHIVFENTVYIIHNSWTIDWGDKHDLRKTADVLDNLDKIAAKVYTKKSGKKLSEIISIQNEETYFYGQDIIDAGFADEIIEAEEDSKKEEKVAFAQNAISETILKMKNKKDYDFKKDCLKAVALIKPVDKNDSYDKKEKKKEDLITAGADKNIKMEVKHMTPEELKDKFPKTYNAIMQMGINKEFERVKSHIIMGRGAGNIGMAVKNIEEQKEFMPSVSAEYMAEQMRTKKIQDIKNDDVDTGGQAGNDDEADTENYVKLLKKKMGVK